MVPDGICVPGRPRLPQFAWAESPTARVSAGNRARIVLGLPLWLKPASVHAFVAEACKAAMLGARNTAMLGVRNIKTSPGYHSLCASISNSLINARVTRLNPARLRE